MDVLDTHSGKSVVIVGLEDEEIIRGIEELEKITFKDAAVNRWILAPFIEFGRVYALVDEFGFVIGSCEIFRAWQAEEAHLFAISIHPDYQSKGLGKFLLDVVLKDLKKWGVKRVKLTVSPKNDIAIKLYESFGFEKEKFVENLYGEGEDRWIMRLEMKD